MLEKMGRKYSSDGTRGQGRGWGIRKKGPFGALLPATAGIKHLPVNHQADACECRQAFRRVSAGLQRNDSTQQQLT